jgi:hypothetical protein
MIYCIRLTHGRKILKIEGIKMKKIRTALLVATFIFIAMAGFAIGHYNSPTKQSNPQIAQDSLPVVSPTKPSAVEEGIQIMLPTGKDDVDSDQTGSAAGIPKPVASARPDGNTDQASGEQVSTSTGRPCRTRTDAGLVQFQSGDFYVTLLQCERKGNLVHFSGTVQYQGDGTSLVGIEKFFVSDSTGKSYRIENGQFGGLANFGYFYTEHSVDSGVPVAFSFDAGFIESGSPPTINLVMPTTFGVERSARSRILFTGLILGD